MFHSEKKAKQRQKKRRQKKTYQVARDKSGNRAFFPSLKCLIMLSSAAGQWVGANKKGDQKETLEGLKKRGPKRDPEVGLLGQ